MRRLLFSVIRLNVFQTFAPSSGITSTRHISTQLNPLNAGHSKWANIKHIKAAKDGQKAAMFTKIARQLRLAIQEGGSANPALNSQLKSVMEEALRKNMPMATIQNNIKKFTATKTKLQRYTLDVRYKQKVFAVCTIYTDNFSQLKMDMSTVLRKGGAVQLDASHLFENFGLIQASVDKALLASISDLEEKVTEDAIECGAEDVEIVSETGDINFICQPEGINGVRKAIEKKGYIVDNAEHIYTPLNTVTLTPEEKAEYDKFLNKLKDIQGIEDVYDNVVEMEA